MVLSAVSKSLQFTASKSVSVNSVLNNNGITCYLYRLNFCEIYHRSVWDQNRFVNFSFISASEGH